MSEPRKTARPRIEAFNFERGRIIARRYEVVGRLGSGWESEVYLVRERSTGIERAAKFMFPHRNVGDRISRIQAKKLHALRHCPIVIQYHHQDVITYRGVPVTMLVSEYVEGQLLSAFLDRQPQKRLSPFHAVHLLHALAAGMECIHQLGEYHGDLHTDNVIVRRYGLGFDLKLLDLFHWEAPKRENIRGDVVDLIRIFYDALGGQLTYRAQPPEVKAIICGLKKTLILKKFRTAGQLRAYLETMEWS